MLTTNNQVDAISQIPLSISVGNRCYFSFFVSLNKWIRLFKFKLLFAGPENLLGKVVIDEGSFECQISGPVNAVCAVFVVIRRLSCSLIDSEQVQFRVVSLVKEKLIANSLNNNV